MREREAGEITVQSAWRALRRRIRVVLICLVLCPAAAIAFSLLQMKEYSATASLLFRDPQFDQQVFGSSYVESYKDPTREAATNVELVSLDEVADKTAKRVRRGFTGKSVLDAVEIKPEGQSDVVSLTATSRSPQLAAKLARAFAGEFVRFRRDADRAKIREAQALVRRDIRRSRGTPRSRRSLSERLDQLGVLASLQTGNAEVVQPPEVPREASSPKPVRNGVLGLILGGLFGVAIALLLDRLDRRLRDPSEIEELLERPILAALPESRALQNPGPGLAALPEHEQEAFRMLRANLRYFSLSREIRSVLVTSATSGDGKSTVAWGLGFAAASAGSRVLVIEADLRHPVLRARYGLRRAGGLTSVLTGELSLATAISHVALRPSTSTDRGPDYTMDVLPAGPLPPNPTDLIESQPMAEIVGQAESEYDLVVIDTPPTSVVSDAIPLVVMVGGVIVVARIGKTTRQTFLKLQSQLANIGAPVLGAVANSLDRGTEDEYGYGYGYGHRNGRAGEPALSRQPVVGR